MGVLKMKWEVVRAEFTHLYNMLNKVISNGGLENMDDCKVFADLELLPEKAGELVKLDKDEYASKCKRISLCVQKCLSAAFKMEEDGNSISNVNKRKFKLPTLELKKFRGDVRARLMFWEQFKKRDEDPETDDADKFHYLLQLHPKPERRRWWRVFRL